MERWSHYLETDIQKFRKLSQKYWDRFAEEVYNKYSDDEDGPYYEVLPGSIAGLGDPFEKKEYIEFIERCLQEDKPWQEIPELRKKIEEWWKQLDDIPEGVLYD